MTVPEAPTTTVKSADRALLLLEVLGKPGPEPNATELARRTGIPRSSLHGLLHTLINRTWIQESSEGTYSLAPTALTVGVSYLDRDLAVAHATEGLERARERLGYTVNLARMIDGDVIYLATREAAARKNLPTRLGRRVPAYATALGRSLLAELSVAESRAILEAAPRRSITANTVTDLDELIDEVALVRDRGYAVEHSQTLEDVACVGVAVPYRIPATDAISCSMSIEDTTPEEIKRVTTVLAEEAHAVAQTLRRIGVR